MDEIKLTSFGGADTVTGSKHLLEFNSKSFLIDCGVFQGPPNLNEKNFKFPNLDIKSLDAIFITHAHLDHCGYLPYLIRKGYVGPIYTTQETKELMEISLRDSASLLKKNKNEDFYYDLNDVHRTIKLCQIKDVENSFIHKGAKVTFFNASHILGSVFIQFEIDKKKITFSGDLGRYDSYFHPAPHPLPETDHLIVESTYGTNNHEKLDLELQIKNILDEIVKKKSTLLVAAFAIDRTQLLLNYFCKVLEKHNFDLPITLTGNMGNQVTKVYQKYSEKLLLPNESWQRVEDKVRFIEHSNELKGFLEKASGPQIIVAGSGMLSGGTIVSHLEKYAQESKNIILLTGYQAEGTAGRLLLSGEKVLSYDEKKIEVSCKIEQLKGLSAHCDFDSLQKWIKSAPHTPKFIYLIHGEGQRKESIYTQIGKIYLTQITQVSENTTYLLK